MLSIVLSRRNWREFDQIISLYTKDNGKIEILAKGIKKITSKNSAHLEPFCLVEVEIVQGKEIVRLIRAQTINLFLNIRNNFEKIRLTSYIISLVDRMTKPNEKDERIFYLMNDWLLFLNNVSTPNAFLVYGFITSFFKLLGYFPDLTRCVICHKKNNLLWFDIRKGGLLCDVCQRNDTLNNYQYELSKSLNDINTLFSSDWTKINHLQINDKLIKIIIDFVSYHNNERILPFKPL